MGNLNFKHHKLQGRIEGNIKKLRVEHERLMRKAKRCAKGSPPSITVKIDDSIGGEWLSPSSPSVSPPPAPVVVKRRRLVVDDNEDLRRTHVFVCQPMRWLTNGSFHPHFSILSLPSSMCNLCSSPSAYHPLTFNLIFKNGVKPFFWSSWWIFWVVGLSWFM